MGARLRLQRSHVLGAGCVAVEQPSWLRWSFATAGVGFLGYCVYFDYKRRNDKEFRRAIRALQSQCAR